ncbi:MAG: hypothetical protein JO099_11775 [Acidobacteriia bacterium]|nr:hypothetical protein [Terriglobia bacterium]
MKTHRVTIPCCTLVSAILFLPPTTSANTVVMASDDAIIQPGGPRTTNGGTTLVNYFFNAEGSNNGSFSSFAVADFQMPAGVTFGPTDTLSLLLTQDDAAFTVNGSLLFYLTSDTTTNIGLGSPLIFNSASLPTGLDSQLSQRYLLGTGTFAEGTSGQTDVFTFSPTGAALSYLASDVGTGGLVRLIVAPGDPNVAATYAGISNLTYPNGGPELIISAVPEPSYGWLGAGLLAALCGFRHWKAQLTRSVPRATSCR